jgi:tripartite ATP-independent transporter DctM subunit
MATGLPVAFCFTLIAVVGAFIFWGYDGGSSQIIVNIREAISRFYLLPIAMFVLLGNIMFESGMAIRMLDAMNKWLGHLPGRLGLLAVAFCTLFATMSGSQMATASMMGTILTPEMEKRGYKKPISIGAVLGAGGLAMIIPPSGLAILLGAIANISIGRLLISGIVPGLIIACLYAGYIIIRCWLQPSVAPPYQIERTPLSLKLLDTVRYVLPLGIIIFLVLGLIFLGWATPTESAVLGALGAFILAIGYRKLSWGVVKKSVMRTVQTATSVLVILTAAKTFSQILGFSGVTQGIAEIVTGLSVAPILLVVVMLGALLVLGTFMDPTSMILVTMPIFMPIVLHFGLSPVWFGLMVLLTMEMAGTTPPVGMMLFVMKSVAPPDTKMTDIYKAGLPFLGCDLIALVLVMMFPILPLWLPGLMRG